MLGQSAVRTAIRPPRRPGRAPTDTVPETPSSRSRQWHSAEPSRWRRADDSTTSTRGRHQVTLMVIERSNDEQVLHAIIVWLNARLRRDD